jgi:hypothetical protein
MPDNLTIVAGIPIPSTSPLFLFGVGIHILLGLACIVAGLVAMLSKKGLGQHAKFGTIYYDCLLGLFVTATALAVVRWPNDYHLFILGLFSFASASVGRQALRRRWRCWPYMHVPGMGMSYVLMLTAFYVDNGKNLPLWRELPQIAFWILPSAIGIPIVGLVLLRHPIVRQNV